jgi:ketosteroid isomerase-like protein
MKKNFFRVALFSGSLALLVSCNPKKDEGTAAAGVDKEQIKKEIQAKENEFAAVVNSRQPKDIGYYADDATSFAQGRQPLVGKQAIVDFYKSGMDSSAAGSTISFTTNEVFVSDNGNQVVEVGYYKLVDASNANVNSGNYMILFEKRNGSYVSVREMSTSDMTEE